MHVLLSMITVMTRQHEESHDGPIYFDCYHDDDDYSIMGRNGAWGGAGGGGGGGRGRGRGRGRGAGINEDSNDDEHDDSVMSITPAFLNIALPVADKRLIGFRGPFMGVWLYPKP